MRNVILLLTPLISLAGFAQPVFTNGHFPVAGDIQVIRDVDTTGIEAGPSGASVSWSFNVHPSLIARTLTWMLPSETPYQSIFPQTHLASEENGTYQFYLSDSALRLVGVAGSQQMVSYDSSAILLKTPLEFGDSIIQSYNGNGTESGTAYSFTGTDTLRYDAYGSLLIPWASLVNVIRLAQSGSIIRQDSGALADTTFYIRHHWYLPSEKFPVLTIETISGSGFEEKTVTVNDVFVSQKEYDIPVALKVYPNPCRDVLHLINAEEGTVRLMDLTGRILMEFKSKSGENILQMDELQSGAYILSHSRNGAVRNQIVIRQ